MSRQAQNVLMGAVACAVVAAAMLAAIMMFGSGDGPTTAAIDPLAGTVADGAGSAGIAAGSLDDAASSTIDRVPLAVAITTTSITSSTSSTDPSSTTTVPSTTASSTTAAPTTTAAPITASTTAASQTTAPGSSTETSADSPTTSGASVSTKPPDSQPTTTIEPATTTVAPQPTLPPAGGSLNEFEREIARLTNELRTNPNGPLKRQGPVINCGGRIRVDMAAGKYDPIGALVVHERASLEVARPWSAQMSRSNFKHRPNAGVAALQDIGVAVRSAGENIAYHNYPDKAFNHFSGWRESDGHFCNMMDPGFTHIGVGEVTKADGISYATQNFFSLR